MLLPEELLVSSLPPHLIGSSIKTVLTHSHEDKLYAGLDKLYKGLHGFTIIGCCCSNVVKT